MQHPASHPEPAFNLALTFRQSSHRAIVLATDAPRWTILEVNAAYLVLSGRRREDLIGRGLFEAFPQPEDTPAGRGMHPVQRTLAQALATGQHVDVEAQRYDLPSSSVPGEFEEHYWDLSTCPLVDERGGIVALLHEVKNATDRVRAARDREQLMEELTDANDGLQTQALELELGNQQLQEAAVELELQAEELQVTAALLEERTEEAETARKAAERSEAQFHTLADAIPTLAWTARADGYIDWYNARWYEYTGTTPQQMEGWGWTTVHQSETLPAVLARWRASIATGEPFAMNFPLRGGDGVFRAFLTRVVPVRDADGSVTRWFGTNTDVEVETCLRRDAEDANRAKSEFLAVMSHELRTPLNAIGGFAELLELGLRGPVTTEQSLDLARIQTSQRHLLGLIDGVLNFSRLEAGVVQYHVDDVVVDELLATCEALMTPQVRDKRLSLRYLGCDASLLFPTDGEKMRQIVLNLLGNAVEFTEPGGRLELGCITTAAEMRISISDTGLGIAADQLERVFEPFVQVDARLTRTHHGVGLGLAISRDLARGMGGDLTAESTLGVGSTFTLTLPRLISRSVGTQGTLRSA